MIQFEKIFSFNRMIKNKYLSYLSFYFLIRQKILPLVLKDKFIVNASILNSLGRSLPISVSFNQRVVDKLYMSNSVKNF